MDTGLVDETSLPGAEALTARFTLLGSGSAEDDGLLLPDPHGPGL